MSASEQSWDDESFCDTYESTWEISEDEAHYGWLSPGENQLHLMQGITKPGAAALDVGCGMGQNLIALAKKGVKAYGFDISTCMLEKASRNVSRCGLESVVTLERGDMRCFTGFAGIQFDLILSVYSMEYLAGVQEFRVVIDGLYKRLKPNGLFIVCFSHPSQAKRYPELMNNSVPLGVGKYKTFNYSFKDATNALFKAGFSVERIVEQVTKNPSTITYEESKQFPYHFRDGKNPCNLEYDEISNGSPHTVIYKARKHNEIVSRQSRQAGYSFQFRELWGYKRKIINRSRVRFFGIEFDALFLAPMDNIIGVLNAIEFSVKQTDMIAGYVSIEDDVLGRSVDVDANSILGLAYRKLKACGMDVKCGLHAVDGDDGGQERRMLIEAVLGLEGEVARVFGTTRLGLLVFVNGKEPAQGELPLDLVMAKQGDRVEVTYVAYTDRRKKNRQIPLFGR